ncbi:NfeD family protein [Brevibacillus humidisoli]|uniref:NfeD family protein n=1 Tax=Brevibacillus humidisoli TaxID=2895522 RepID=UPI001E4670E0|nr:NfeD family protein [Brevibacillus humidisoli]UFJ39716.1 NfeD family protein [Brevibacillus humidisoli]
MEWLDTLFVACIGFALLYAFITLFLGDVAGDFLDSLDIPMLQPLTLISGIAAFGGTGFLLKRLTDFSDLLIIALAVIGGAVISLAAYFIWIEPMKDAETSTGFSMADLIGRSGEVLTTIPAEGVGEVLITMVNGTTNHVAASLQGEAIAEGTQIRVAEVQDHVLYVVPHKQEKERFN